MKTQCTSTAGWRAVYLVAGCLTVLSPAADAQVLLRKGVVSGAGPGVGFAQHIDGSGSGRGIVMVVAGPDGPIDIGASLLKACDASQDGAASPEEVRNGLLTWFRQADTDTNGALSGVELATALRQIFPVPPPPPGLPALPEELALHNLLAAQLMAAGDANNDGWLVFKEGITLIEQNVAQWDSDSNGSLDASEFAAAFAQFMPEPSGQKVIGGATRRLP
jgi:hypothetical protein